MALSLSDSHASMTAGGQRGDLEAVQPLHGSTASAVARLVQPDQAGLEHLARYLVFPTPCLAFPGRLPFVRLSRGHVQGSRLRVLGRPRQVARMHAFLVTGSLEVPDGIPQHVMTAPTPKSHQKLQFPELPTRVPKVVFENWLLQPKKKKSPREIPVNCHPSHPPIHIPNEPRAPVCTTKIKISFTNSRRRHKSPGKRRRTAEKRGSRHRAR